MFPFAWVVFKTTIALAIATVAFDLPVQWPGAAFAVPVALLGALSFAPFGLLVTAVVLIMKQALGITSWLVAGLSIVAGFYFPVSLLPDWIEWFSEVQPFTPTIELMRSTLVGIEMSEAAWLAVAKLVGFAAVLTPIAIWVLAKAVHVSRRRGTIIEY
jgi:ABC-2 type transport system permease protein